MIGLAAALGVLAGASPVGGDEKIIELAGRIDATELGIPPGRFTVRALRPQKRSGELARATGDADGRFRVRVAEEAVGVYGVLLEATSATAPVGVLEVAVLSLREARAPVTLDGASTLAAAMMDWKVRRHANDFERVRPLLLQAWVQPLLVPKARQGLGRARAALLRWALAAAPAGGSVASVLKASVGDVRQIRARLAAAGVAVPAVDQLDGMARTDAEVAYLLMLPYLLEL